MSPLEGKGRPMAIKVANAATIKRPAMSAVVEFPWEGFDIGLKRVLGGTKKDSEDVMGNRPRGLSRGVQDPEGQQHVG